MWKAQLFHRNGNGSHVPTTSALARAWPGVSMASLSAEKVMAFSACGGRLFRLHTRSMSVLPSGCRSCLCQRRVNHTAGERRGPDAAPSPTTSGLPHSHVARSVLEQELDRARAATSGDLRPWFLNSGETTSQGPIPLPAVRTAHLTLSCLRGLPSSQSNLEETVVGEGRGH